MRQALYRKYRSRSFDEVVGQEYITSTLNTAIQSGRISHAYLFTGPRGVGKTSVARILAHEVNRLPYKGEAVHLDIIEIDAASNRRIDEVRDLRERVRVAPTSAKYKVYIIDEVHMLTREAFNALLKTLEEPPAHVIFILATTEGHKLPETIISRTQRFEFKPITPADAIKHLSDIAKREKIEIDREALELLASFGKGSFRDSISYLDQLSARKGKVTAGDVRSALGIPSQAEISRLLAGVQSGALPEVLDSLQAIRAKGVEASQAADALAEAIRQVALVGNANQAVINLLKQLLEVTASSRPYDYLEIIVLEAAQQNNSNSISPEPSVLAPRTGTTPKTRQMRERRKDTTPPKADKPALDLDLSKWDKVVDQSRSKAASIYTALKLANPELENDVLILRFQFPLHQKKIDVAKNKQLVSSLVEEVFGESYPIRCVVDKDVFAKTSDSNLDSTSPDIDGDPNLTSINNIFGAAEVLES